jgi:hypothetical protein
MAITVRIREFEARLLKGLWDYQDSTRTGGKSKAGQEACRVCSRFSFFAILGSALQRNQIGIRDQTQREL